MSNVVYTRPVTQGEQLDYKQRERLKEFASKILLSSETSNRAKAWALLLTVEPSKKLINLLIIILF